MSWFHVDARPHDLAVLRIAVFGIWVVIALGTPLQTAADLPAWLFTPRGPWTVIPLDGLVGSVGWLWALRLAVIVGGIACAIGGRSYTVLAGPTALAVLVMHGVMTGVGGFVNHAQIAVLYAAWLLALQRGVGAAHLGDMATEATTARQQPSRSAAGAPFALASVGLVVALAYSLLALRRITRGGAEIYLDGSTGIMTIARSLEYAQTSFRVGSLIEGSTLLLGLVAVGFLVSTIFELLAPLALLNSRFRVVWVGYMVVFHLSTIVMMNIAFLENLVLIVVVFTRVLRPRGDRSSAMADVGSGPLSIASSGGGPSS
ncbi:MAG: hypothetical protein JJT89_00965 [Nitriliruptoraceae bacterium]|nr:hypothetical protein [Nitriliruptoraceae bacterium]